MNSRETCQTLPVFCRINREGQPVNQAAFEGYPRQIQKRRSNTSRMFFLPFFVFLCCLPSLHASCQGKGIDGVTTYLLYETAAHKLSLQIHEGENVRCTVDVNMKDMAKMKDYRLISYNVGNEKKVVFVFASYGKNAQMKAFMSDCSSDKSLPQFEMTGTGIDNLGAFCHDTQAIFGKCLKEPGKCAIPGQKDYIKYGYQGKCAYGYVRGLMYKQSAGDCATYGCLLDTANKKLMFEANNYRACRRQLAVHGPASLCQNGDDLDVIVFGKKRGVCKLGSGGDNGVLAAYSLDLEAYVNSMNGLKVVQELGTATKCAPKRNVSSLFRHGTGGKPKKAKLAPSTWCTDEIEPFVKIGSIASAFIAVLLTVCCIGGVISVRIATNRMIAEGRPLPPKPWEKRRGNDTLQTVGVTENLSAYGTVGTTISEYSQATEISKVPTTQGTTKNTTKNKTTTNKTTQGTNKTTTNNNSTANNMSATSNASSTNNMSTTNKETTNKETTS